MCEDTPANINHRRIIKYKPHQYYEPIQHDKLQREYLKKKSPFKQWAYNKNLFKNIKIAADKIWIKRVAHDEGEIKICVSVSIV